MDMMGRVLSVRAETSLTRSLEMTTGVRMPGSGECRVQSCNAVVGREGESGGRRIIR